MNEAQFKMLLERYINDQLSSEELSVFIAYLRTYNNAGQLEELVDQALQDSSFSGLSDRSKSENIFQKILQQAKSTEAASIPGEPLIKTRSGRSTLLLWRWAAAASLLIGISVISYVVLSKKNQKAAYIAGVGKTEKAPATDAEPGSNRAVLKLADGHELVLDSTGTGTIARQGHSTVLKTRDGQLAYNTSAEPATETVYNTLSTPRGGQYQLRLPDGSKVWLNAASSLRFPVAFSEKDRVVELTGEAYFEIARLETKNGERRPFIVRNNNQKDNNTDWQVEVLGTHFNIMAYANETSVQTSLLEGSVAFSTAGKPAVKIKPNQQAILYKDRQKVQVNNADVVNAIAWKEGLFHFISDDIQHIIRQLERWYDVNGIYTGAIPPGHYSGIVSRDSKLSTVLKILEESGLHFKIQDKTLTIFPQ
jgi:ferric-dicitrate binding protein FerR (iron transport regulator)